MEETTGVPLKDLIQKTKEEGRSIIDEKNVQEERRREEEYQKYLEPFIKEDEKDEEQQESLYKEMKKAENITGEINQKKEDQQKLREETFQDEGWQKLNLETQRKKNEVQLVFESIKDDPEYSAFFESKGIKVPETLEEFKKIYVESTEVSELNQKEGELLKKNQEIEQKKRENEERAQQMEREIGKMELETPEGWLKKKNEIIEKIEKDMDSFYRNYTAVRLRNSVNGKNKNSSLIELLNEKMTFGFGNMKDVQGFEKAIEQAWVDFYFKKLDEIGEKDIQQGDNETKKRIENLREVIPTKIHFEFVKEKNLPRIQKIKDSEEAMLMEEEDKKLRKTMDSLLDRRGSWLDNLRVDFDGENISLKEEDLINFIGNSSDINNQLIEVNRLMEDNKQKIEEIRKKWFKKKQKEFLEGERERLTEEQEKIRQDFNNKENAINYRRLEVKTTIDELNLIIQKMKIRHFLEYPQEGFTLVNIARHIDYDKRKLLPEELRIEWEILEKELDEAKTNASGSLKENFPNISNYGIFR